jgi:DNA-binding HxlR family transcriptional regulator
MEENASTRRSTCPISAALEVVGDRWSLLIVRDMLFGGARTFKDFSVSAEGIATNILTSRLAKLQAHGIVNSQRNPDDGRGLIYRLTPKGISLAPVLMELSRWGTEYEAGEPPPDILDAWIADRAGFLARLPRG